MFDVPNAIDLPSINVNRYGLRLAGYNDTQIGPLVRSTHVFSELTRSGETQVFDATDARLKLLRVTNNGLDESKALAPATQQVSNWEQQSHKNDTD